MKDIESVTHSVNNDQIEDGLNSISLQNHVEKFEYLKEDISRLISLDEREHYLIRAQIEEVLSIL